MALLPDNVLITKFSLSISNTSPTDDGFADNDDFETEADEILDFSERNPFGIP